MVMQALFPPIFAVFSQQVGPSLGILQPCLFMAALNMQASWSKDEKEAVMYSRKEGASASVSGVGKSRHFAVTDRFWGYSVRTVQKSTLSVVLAQALSFLLGVASVVAAVELLILSPLFFDGDLTPMRIGAAAILGAIGAYLLWFASRGAHTEVEIDTNIAEVREVICHRAGRPTVAETYGFDEIGGVCIEASEKEGLSMLFLRYRDTDQIICVAEAPEAELTDLRDRLAQDLLGMKAGAGRTYAT
jgi:hypothetical protein